MAGSHEVRGSNPLFSTMNSIAGRAIGQRFFYVQIEGPEPRHGYRQNSVSRAIRWSQSRGGSTATSNPARVRQPCGLLGKKYAPKAKLWHEFRVIPLENAG